MGCSGRKKPLAGRVARLEKLGIEYQLQLAQLVFLVLSPPKFQELFIRDEIQLARFCRTWRGGARAVASVRSGPSQRPQCRRIRSMIPARRDCRRSMLLSPDSSGKLMIFI